MMKKNKAGLEYLGFRYDGHTVYIRNSTISRLYRKVSRAIKKEAFLYVKKHSDWDIETLLERFNYSLFARSFGRIDKRIMLKSDIDRREKCNFYSYLKRAVYTFQYKNENIAHQVNNLSKFIQKRIKKAVEIQKK